MNKRPIRRALGPCLDLAWSPAVRLRESLVISGFWRSGTTWLQERCCEALDAKPVFEPFQARAGLLRWCLSEIRPPDREQALLNGIMPFAARTFPPHSRVRLLLAAVLRGPFRQGHLSRKTPRLRSCLRRRVVTKCTRLALCLRATVNAFPVAAIHVRRDPRAVLASLKRGPDAQWGEGAFSNFRLADHLLRMGDGRAAWFGRWEADILEIQRRDDFARLAAYYALTERFLESEFASGGARFALLRHEDLVRDGPGLLDRSLSGLGLSAHPLSAEAFATPSSTTFAGGRLPARGAGWKEQLTPREIRTIEEVLVHFDMEHAMVDGT
mgnify:CR=1 FL=1